MCVGDSLCCTAENNTTWRSGYTPIKILKKNYEHSHFTSRESVLSYVGSSPGIFLFVS